MNEGRLSEARIRVGHPGNTKVLLTSCLYNVQTMPSGQVRLYVDVLQKIDHRFFSTRLGYEIEGVALTSNAKIRLNCSQRIATLFPLLRSIEIGRAQRR